jgi:putative membrane protein
MIRRLALLMILSLLVGGVALTQRTIGQQSQTTTTQKAGKTAASSTPQSAMKLSGDDEKFVMKAAEGGKAEVELGNLALSKASSADVKQFAQRMVDDHSKAGDELAQLAQSKGITLPMSDATAAVNASDPDVARMNTSTTTSAKKDTNNQKTSADMNHDKMMKSDGQKMADKLSKLSGADFDRAYMKHMVDDHVKDVAMFEKEAKNGKDADLKAWANKTLPTLREHLQMARDVDMKVSGKTASSTTKPSNK